LTDRPVVFDKVMRQRPSDAIVLIMTSVAVRL